MALAGAVIAFVPARHPARCLPEAAGTQPHGRGGQVTDGTSRPAARCSGWQCGRFTASPALAGGPLVSIGLRRATAVAISGPARRPASRPACPLHLKALAKPRARSTSPSGTRRSQANDDAASITTSSTPPRPRSTSPWSTSPSYDDTWEEHESGLSAASCPTLSSSRTSAPRPRSTPSLSFPSSPAWTPPLLDDATTWPGCSPTGKWRGPVCPALRRLAPIVFYNQNAFTKAGLDPADPPLTLPQDGGATRAQEVDG